MIGYWFPPDPKEFPPPTGLLPGRWWLWDELRVSPPRVDASTRWYLQELGSFYDFEAQKPLCRPDSTPVTTQPLLYMPVVDAEMWGDLPEPAILRVSESFRRQGFTKFPVIGWRWPGHGPPATWNMQRNLRGMTVPSSYEWKRMTEFAKRDQPIVRMAGMATCFCGMNPADDFSFWLEYSYAQMNFMRRSYPGVEICAWVAWSPHWSPAHAARYCDMLWGWDSFCLHCPLKDCQILLDEFGRRGLTSA